MPPTNEACAVCAPERKQKEAAAVLVLDKVTKEYPLGDHKVEALREVSIRFRKREFVSVLGPSGCGKTTLLNLIGGLDQPTAGDMQINGRSTRSYGDHDWDVYRNRSVGFVFQNYCLIPHQTALGNVELALTIAGVGRQERIERAKKALDRVGLSGDYDKLPSQLSGGEQQRVAIARALVNDPEILLADEPTGALDSGTSRQIMELIREIAKDRLVIMVTHNPELASEYSTRIVRLLDGSVIEDSDPYELREEAGDAPEARDGGRARMSFFTVLRLSVNNLLSKLSRTVIVILAGSIGIIGVSAVLAISAGVREYLAAFQEDMLSGNPITIEESGVDYAVVLDSSSLVTQYKALEFGDWVNVNSIMDYLVTHQSTIDELLYTNELDRDYVNYVLSMPEAYYKDIMLNYGLEITPSIYTDFRVFNLPRSGYEKYNKCISIHAITEIYAAMLEQTEYRDYSSYITGLGTAFREGIANNEFIASQYDLLAGTLPQNSHDVLVVLNDNEQLSDILLAQLGYYTMEEFYHLTYKTRFSYEEIMNKRFTWYPNDTIYEDRSVRMGEDLLQVYDYSYEEQADWDDGVELNICGIVKPKSSLSFGALKLGFIYTEDFALEVIERNRDSRIAENIRSYGSVQSFPLDGELRALYGIDHLGISYELEYVFGAPGHEPMKTVYVGKTNSGVKNTVMSYLGAGGAGGAAAQTASSGLLASLANSRVMDLNAVGGTYLPQTISIYPNNFADKDLVTEYLEAWNMNTDLTFRDYREDLIDLEQGDAGTKTLSKSQRGRVKYSDQVQLVSMANSVINVVTYALIVFTALSLIVSTAMVGIITYVSVMERVREIGVIRSLGGRKRDVSALFVAETFVIGLCSGAVGVAVTAGLGAVGNLVIRGVSDGAVARIAHLTWGNALLMVAVSVLLTLISGLIPARIAAGKNPVEALRTE